MPKIKIMRLQARLSVSGPSIHTTLLTEHVDTTRFDTHFVTGVTGASEGNMHELMNVRSVQPIILRGMGREISPLNDLRTVFQLVRLMRRHRPHIVDTHTAKAGFVGRLAARICGVPVVIHTFHGNVFKGYFGAAKTRVFLGIERFLARFTDCIIVLSEQQKTELLGLGIGRAEQYRVIPLGLDLQPFLTSENERGKLREELGIGEAPIAGVVARLAPIKALHLFLQAAQKVLQNVPDAIFVLAGDGESRAQLEQQAQELGIAEAVRFLGFRADLTRIYADFDCFVLCSINEGLPVAVIEALAAARPVVATNVGGVGDLILHDKTGWLCESGDVAALAQGIETALTDRARAASWAQNGRDHVYPNLDISRLVTDMEMLYADEVRRKKLVRDGKK